MLHAQVFLQNTPFGALHGYSGLSPTLSLPSECQALDPANPSQLNCVHENADEFVKHFSQRWDGDRPLPAAHLYYDSIVLLAMGLDYGLGTTGELPGSTELQAMIRKLSAEGVEKVSWSDLSGGFESLSKGTPVRYVGAAAEYAFDEYGAAEYTIFDTWTIEGRSFVDAGPLMASCPRNL
jgi:neutral amino acid transport system substrate-binding protein